MISLIFMIFHDNVIDHEVRGRVRCTYKNSSNPGQQSDEHAQQLDNSAEVTVHVTLSRAEKVMETYETVNDRKGECTYANVKKTNRKSRSDKREPFNHIGGTEKQTGPDDEYCLTVDNSPKLDDPRELGTINGVVCIKNEKQEENNSQVYAVVHKDCRRKVSGGSFHSKRRMDTRETANSRKEESTYETVQLTDGKSRSDGGEYINRKGGGEKKARSEDRCSFPLGSTRDLDATKKSETQGVVDVETKKQEENKDRVYAVANKGGKGKVSGSSFHVKAKYSLKDDTPLEPVNGLSSVESVNRLSDVQPAVCLSSVDPVNPSSSVAETGLKNKKAVADEGGPAGDEKKDYVYAVVDKANKKRKPPQVIFFT